MKINPRKNYKIGIEKKLHEMAVKEFYQGFKKLIASGYSAKIGARENIRAASVRK